jgi:D-glycero-D-manno-heptose 1,7-bisphosphate phosphatase
MRRSDQLVMMDRDGVINYDSDAYIKSPREWRPIPGALRAIASLHAAGYLIFIVSNQSGVGRGLLSAAALDAINAHMVQAIERAGGRVAGIYCCPHRPEDACDCRKPAPGLLHRLEVEHGVSLEGQPFIGDKWSDLQAARAVGSRPILVRTGRGETTLGEHADSIPEVYDDLVEAAAAILESRGQRA